MVKINCTEIDETLKLLNGLQRDADKRIEICRYIEQNGVIYIFAYGSLLWNPIGYVANTVHNCTLQGYSKGFICEDCVYRGTLDFTGLTLALRENLCGHVKGALLSSTTDQIIPFLRAFVERESPTIVNGTTMDIYNYDFVKITLLGGGTEVHALTCVVNTKSSLYSTKFSAIPEQAEKIAHAYGKYGTNLQYLEKLLGAYEMYSLSDSSTDALLELHAKVKEYRQELSMADQQWMQEYDKLQSLEARQNIPKSLTIWEKVKPGLFRSVCLEELSQTLYHSKGA